MISNNFIKRHNGPKEEEVNIMLQTIGAKTIEQLISETIPADIRLPEPLHIGEGMNEHELTNHLKQLGTKNKQYKSFIGLGYYSAIVPGVILRNILENPGWYTSYTPYQAEISQGRLEALFNYQTMISDLTAMPLANASLLDEATAASEAMIMFFNSRSRTQVKDGVNKFFVSETVFPQTIDVLKTRALPLGIEIVIGTIEKFEPSSAYFGVLLQTPDQFGVIFQNMEFISKLKAHEIQLAVAADLMSLALITPPGEWGADAVIGTNQRFGLPLGFGGPHAGYFATTEKYKRNMPGRIIGVTKDAEGNFALRMALQTREQHIKREKATSNICTASALMAIMSGFYGLYHGQDGIKEIARHIHILTNVLNIEMQKLGVKQCNENFFDTLLFELPENTDTKTLQKTALEHQMNFRYINEKQFGISIDETTSLTDINIITLIVSKVLGKTHLPFICKPEECAKLNAIPDSVKRTSPFMTHEIFNHYRSETDMMRYMKKLENRDLSLNRCMIPLGSCTMKLNAATEMFALSWPEFGNIHPFVPENQAAGYLELINTLDKDLSEITGLAGMSFMPNSGASGEYAGLIVIRDYLRSIGQTHRNICLIPASAHGTNPASAAMAGFKIIIVKTDENGNIDMNDLNEKAVANKDNLACIMVTYPSTHGIYESGIRELVAIIHENGGQVYMDGANMNAQVGLTSPGFIGADVCHLNLHKTFAMPHGGGGPGVGPIGVAKHLKPFLPSHKLFKTGGENQSSAVSAAPFGSALLLTITYAYIKLLGGAGLKQATEYAILNANYLKEKLKNHYPILYVGENGRVAHEMILDCNSFHRTADIAVIDIAKRLMDFGFHAPTVAFPVHGTLMVEPTESEPLEELDRFVDAMITIRKEIAEIEEGKAEKDNNVITHAPYTVEMLLTSDWNYSFSREEAGFPLKSKTIDKYFPAVTRVDDAYGDRNLVCTWNQVNDME
ncbi:MAG: aminomethyl-transferring glycine dehydrogenase [Lentimicrobiaceae bacterium]|jgi:glycine dehydrogenase|nr:aminomethyl-transferring glycine dehydrogenase [Lentimicrobiaceae bacterium]